MNGQTAKNIKTPEPDHQDEKSKPEAKQARSDAGTIKFTPKELLNAAYSEQDGDAELFVKIQKNRFCFDHASGRWFVFEGHYWREDLLNEPLAGVDDVTELYVQETKRLSWAIIEATKAERREEAIKAEFERKVFLKKISELQKIQWKKSVLQLAAAGKDSLGITGNEWDSDPWALPCINGVVNLGDGTFRPGKPEDYFKTVCPTEWKGLDEPSPTWDSFEATITDDKDIPGFKRRLFGSALPGTVIERVLPIFDGPGGQNGKGTELETIKFTLGPLAGPIPSELLLKQSKLKDPDAPSASVMALRGKRIVWASETERGKAFNTQKAKWLTGGDTLVGRDPFGKRQVTFVPSHSIFLLTNDKPRVPASDHAFWERAFLIKFPFTFKENPTGKYERKRDAHLLEKLKAEASGILAWLVRGCLEWQQQGLNPPESVREHTGKYRKDEDQIARFIEDKCVTGQGREVKSSVLSNAYRVWCEENGETPVKGREFTDEIGKQFDSYHKNTGNYYIGLALGRDQESEGTE